MKISVCSSCGYIIQITEEVSTSVEGLPAISHTIGPACIHKLYGPALRRAQERRRLRAAIRSQDNSVLAQELREFVEANR